MTSPVLPKQIIDPSLSTIHCANAVKRVALLAPCTLLLAAFFATADTTINSVKKHAYGANIGWINLAGDTTNGVVVGEFFLSGSAFGANVGWISFGGGSPANGTA